MISTHRLHFYNFIRFIIFLACLYSAHGAPSTATSSSSSVAPTTASTVPNITYPTNLESSIALASFQDTVRVSWTPLPENQTAVLQIICWNRSVDWEGIGPVLTSNLSNQLGPEPTYDVLLTPYKIYNPCRFDVGFFWKGNFTWLYPSGGVAINETSDPNGPTTWTVDHQAPMGSLATNVTTSAGRKRFNTNCFAPTVAMLFFIGALV